METNGNIDKMLELAEAAKVEIANITNSIAES